MSTLGIPTKISILLVDESRMMLKTMTDIVAAAADMRVAGTATTGQDGMRRALELEPDAILMDINFSDADGIQVAFSLSSRLPNTSIVITTAEDSSAMVQRAMLAGAQAYLTKPLQPELVLQTIRDVRERHRERLSRMLSVSRQDKDRDDVEQIEHRGRRIVVFGAKGGVGKTTIAANLALALRLRTGKEVVAVDANFYFGDLGLHLNVASKLSIVDLIPYANDMDSSVLNRVMAVHPSGLRVLVAPPRPEQAELVKVEHLNRLLTALPRVFDFVIIDSQHHYDDIMLAALDDANMILVVMTPEIGAVRNTKHFLRLANILGYGRDRVMLVLNRADSNVGINLAEIEKALGVDSVMPVPSGGRSVSVAVNEGNPLVSNNSKNTWAKAIIEIADQVERRLAGTA